MKTRVFIKAVPFLENVASRNDLINNLLDNYANVEKDEFKSKVSKGSVFNGSSRN